MCNTKAADEMLCHSARLSVTQTWSLFFCYLMKLSTAGITHCWLMKEHCQNDTDKARPKHFQKNRSQCYLIHHKYCTHWPAFKPKVWAVKSQQPNTWAIWWPKNWVHAGHPIWDLWQNGTDTHYCILPTLTSCSFWLHSTYSDLLLQFLNKCILCV